MRDDIDGIAVYRHDGAGPQIVLIHGAMDRGAGMLRVARKLRGRRIVRYDRRGYGRSADAVPASGFSDHLRDLEAVMGDRPSVLLGHSYGGVIAMARATLDPSNVLGIVSFEAPRAWESWWTAPPSRDADPSEVAEHFLRHMIGDEVWAGLPQRTREQRRSEGRALVDELHFQRIQQYDPALIDVPLIVGVGSLSSERTQRAAQLTASEALHGELHVVEGAGHGAHTTHPEALAAMVTSLL